MPVIEESERAEKSELLGFFEYNSNNPEENTPYIKFPEKFIYENKKWRIRKQGTSNIGRVYSIHPAAREVFYLRMLLVDTVFNHSAGKKSFEKL